VFLAFFHIVIIAYAIDKRLPSWFSMQIRKIAQRCQGGINRVLVIYGLNDLNPPKNVVNTQNLGSALNSHLAAGLHIMDRFRPNLASIFRIPLVMTWMNVSSSIKDLDWLDSYIFVGNIRGLGRKKHRKLRLSSILPSPEVPKCPTLIARSGIFICGYYVGKILKQPSNEIA
jgi:hypothetical protein